MKRSSPPPAGLLLIRGLGHSGSTVLDMALGAHPKMLGLGEAVRIVRNPTPLESGKGPARLRGQERFERRCTCGALAAECLVWGDFLPWLSEHDADCDEDKLVELLHRVEGFASHTSEQPLHWIIDSYQADRVMPARLRDVQPSRPVKVVLLVRDVRSWVHSEARRSKGKRLFPVLRGLLRWWRVNSLLEKDLKASGCEVFYMGYEELALAPEQSLGRLCNWLDLDFVETMLTPGGSSRSHILSGNRMRFDPDRSARICYDSAWLSSASFLLGCALLLPPIAAMNRRLVYSQGVLGQSWPLRPSQQRSSSGEGRRDKPQ